MFCGDASRLFLDLIESITFSKHLSSVLGRTELCHEVRNPGPQNPKTSTIKTTTWHCSERVRIVFSPSCCLKIFHRHFSKNISPPKICTKFHLFTATFCRGGTLMTWVARAARHGLRAMQRCRMSNLRGGETTRKNLNLMRVGVLYFGHFSGALRKPPTTKAVRGTVTIKGVFG